MKSLLFLIFIKDSECNSKSKYKIKVIKRRKDRKIKSAKKVKEKGKKERSRIKKKKKMCKEITSSLHHK